MGIDVVFTGLMVVCLNGTPYCPAKTNENTAWVVKADGPSSVCGRNSPEVTQLQVIFSNEEFVYRPYGHVICGNDPLHPTTMTLCTFSTSDLPELSLVPDKYDKENKKYDLKLLPKLAEIDSRFIVLDPFSLYSSPLVPTHIHFKPGKISAGAPWKGVDKDGKDQPAYWCRSTDADGCPGRELSDQMKVTYDEATSIQFTAHGRKVLDIWKWPKGNGATTIKVRNYASKITPQRNNAYDELDYLVWYYRIGVWNTFSLQCPPYDKDPGKSVAVLRCYHQSEGACACRDPNCVQADSVHWPMMLGGAP